MIEKRRKMKMEAVSTITMIQTALEVVICILVAWDIQVTRARTRAYKLAIKSYERLARTDNRYKGY
jgi:hypothetical protein